MKGDKDLKEDTHETLKFLKGMLDKTKDVGLWDIPKKDFSAVSRIVSTPLHYYDKIPTAKRMFLTGNKKRDNQAEIMDRITLNPKTGEHSTKIIHNAQKSNPEYGKIYAPYRINQDVNAVGYFVHQNAETGQFDLFSPNQRKVGEYDSYKEAHQAASAMVKERKVSEFVNDETIFKYYENDKGKWELIIPANKPISSFATDKEAADEMIRQELIDFNEKYHPSPETLKVLEVDKKTVNNVFNVLTQGIRDLITLYESKGWELPITTVRMDGENVAIDLKAALAIMGDRRGHYFPRTRSPGKYMLIAKKATGERFLKFYDIALENPPDEGGQVKRWKSVINRLTPLGREALRKEREGYTIEIKRASRTSEDVFEMHKSIIGMQEKINDALKKVKTNKDLDLVDKETMAFFAQALSEQIANIEKGEG